MALSDKPPVKVAVLADAIANASGARPTHAIVSLRAAVPRLVLTGKMGIRAAVTLRAALPRFDLNGVRAQTLTTIIVSPSSGSINIGDTADLTAQAFDQNGQPMTGITFAWSSSDESIATVDSSGLATGVSAGSVTITAGANGKTGSCNLAVVDDTTVASITITPSSATITAGDTQQLTAQALNAAGDPIDGVTFGWATTNATVAPVDASGLVTGGVAGTATIIATAGGASASCAVTVNAAAYAAATFPTDTAQGDVGSCDTGQVLVQLNDTSGQIIGGQLHTGASDTAMVVADVGHAEVTVEADMIDPSAKQGVCVSVLDGNNYYVAHYSVVGSTTVHLDKVVGGVTTALAQLDVGTHTGRLGLTRRIISGDAGDTNELTVSLGGAVQFSATDSDIAGSTMAGAYGHSAVIDNIDWSSPKYAKAPLSGTILVATTGSDTGAGTVVDPISQAGLLRAAVAAGSDIQLRGGTYSDWVSTFAGTSGSPITVRPYQSEHVTIDGDFQSHGDYVEWWDLELLNSDTARISTQVSSNPTDISRGQKYPAIFGKFNKLINTIHHDHGDGLYAAQEAEGLEVDGALLYNNGWEGPTGNPGETKGYGKSIYSQNSGADKVFRNFACFGSFSSNIQMFGTGDAIILGFQFLKGAIFGAGTPTPTLTSSKHEELDMIGATSTTRGNLTVDGCSVYQDDAIRSNVVRLNAAGDPPGQPVTFTNSIVKGVGLSLNENLAYTFTGDKVTSGDVPIDDQLTLLAYRQAAGVLLTDNTVGSNTYAAVLGNQLPFFYKGDGNPRTFAQWQADTGFDADSTFVNGQFTGDDIVVVPMKYTTGRAFVHCFNWDSAATLDVDLSTVLAEGDQYEVHHVYDVFGTPVVSGTYDGAPVTLSQTGYVAPTPIGYGTQPASQSPKFNVFLVKKVA